jgi:hypothetical protein
MRGAAPAQKGARSHERQEQDGKGAQGEQQELTESNAARVLTFCTAQIAQCREHHPRPLVPLKQVEDDRNRDGHAQQQRGWSKEAHLC